METNRPVPAKKTESVTLFFKLLIPYLPRVGLTRFAGWLSQPQRPEFFRKLTVPWFVQKFSIDMSEAEKGLDEYKSVAELFTRNLKPGLRPIGDGLIHPVDGRLVCGGKITGDQVLQAKDKYYKLSEFLGDTEATVLCQNGTLLTYYLSPQDYHHVHFPFDGEIASHQKLGSDLWPVNPWSLSKHANVFIQNERIVMRCRHGDAVVFMVMVGAVVVGKMKLSYTPRTKIFKGQRIGTFEMGSTVIMIYPEQMNLNLADIVDGKVNFGQSLISLPTKG